MINRGYDNQRNAWRQAVGRALFTGAANSGSLKVSFFGPFYGGYHIIALDKANYSYAMISGPNRDYLWILARSKQLPPPTVLDDLLKQAKSLGYATEQLILVRHDQGAT